MFGKMTPTFLLLGGAILIWSLSLGISAKLADSLGAGKGHGAGAWHDQGGGAAAGYHHHQPHSRNP